MPSSRAWTIHVCPVCDRQMPSENYCTGLAGSRHKRFTAVELEVIPAQETEELLHAMHDASKFAKGTTKAILEGVLHSRCYGRRQGPHRGNRCECPHCLEERV